MKIFLKILLLVGLIAYLVVAFTRIVRGGDTTRCRSVRVVIADSMHAGFITADEVERLLLRANVYPKGVEMDSIDGKHIEDVLLGNSFIKSATCFKTSGGKVNILVSQRLPVMRVKAANGEDYYVDEEGDAMNPQGYHADLVVATGNISKAFTKKRLIHLGRYLQEHPFWNDQIVQMDVAADGRVTLVPRVGRQLIRFGRADSATIGRKFGNLRAFYDKVLPTVGWNTYKEINLEYTNQVICKKTETK